MARTRTSNSSLRCPTVARWKGDLVGCGSANLSEEDKEGLFDCLDCGLFFDRDAALEGQLGCPARLPKGTRTCGSTNLIWHEKEQCLECSDCGNRFSKNEAIRAAQRK